VRSPGQGHQSDRGGKGADRDRGEGQGGDFGRHDDSEIARGKAGGPEHEPFRATFENRTSGDGHQGQGGQRGGQRPQPLKRSEVRVFDRIVTGQSIGERCDERAARAEEEGLESGGHAGDPGEAIEPGVKRQDSADALMLHHRQVNGVPGGESGMAQEHGPSAIDGFEIDREHFVHHTKERVESRLDGVSPFDRRVPVQDFLQNLGIRNQTLLIGDAALENLLSVALVRVRRTHEVHGDVGVNEDHS